MTRIVDVVIVPRDIFSDISNHFKLVIVNANCVLLEQKAFIVLESLINRDIETVLASYIFERIYIRQIVLCNIYTDESILTSILNSNYRSKVRCVILNSEFLHKKLVGFIQFQCNKPTIIITSVDQYASFIELLLQ